MKSATQKAPTALFCLFAGLFIMIGTASSKDEKRQNGDQILALLSDNRVKGADFEQTFGTPDGFSPASTTYWQGNNASFGWWRVENDRYCSQWQQNGPWSCYDVSSFTRNADIHVVWIDDGGRRYEGVVKSR